MLLRCCGRVRPSDPIWEKSPKVPLCSRLRVRVCVELAGVANDALILWPRTAVEPYLGKFPKGTPSAAVSVCLELAKVEDSAFEMLWPRAVVAPHLGKVPLCSRWCVVGICHC